MDKYSTEFQKLKNPFFNVLCIGKKMMMLLYNNPRAIFFPMRHQRAVFLGKFLAKDKNHTIKNLMIGLDTKSQSLKIGIFRFYLMVMKNKNRFCEKSNLGLI